MYSKLKKDRILARKVIEANKQPGILQNRANILKSIFKDNFELWIWGGYIDLAVRVPSGVYHLSVKAV